MPELPEMQVLAERLTERAAGRSLDRVDVLSVAALKTFDPPPDRLGGGTVAGAERRGKFLAVAVDTAADGRLYLVLHLARAGRVRWRESFPAKPPRPGRGPLALRLVLAGGGGYDVTEQGTQKRLSVSVVHDPVEVPGIARLGDDPLAPGFGAARLGELTRGSRSRLKTLLTDQTVLAGIGNAYSDEILHAARLSPFAPSASLDGERTAALAEAVREVLTEAVERARAAGGDDLAAEKREALRVHGREGRPCPRCGTTIRSVNFADSSLQYCPACQTGGRVLADRRLSRLLR